MFPPIQTQQSPLRMRTLECLNLQSKPPSGGSQTSRNISPNLRSKNCKSVFLPGSSTQCRAWMQLIFLPSMLSWQGTATLPNKHPPHFGFSPLQIRDFVSIQQAESICALLTNFGRPKIQRRLSMLYVRTSGNSDNYWCRDFYRQFNSSGVWWTKKKR
jgi:hypothetical protein